MAVSSITTKELTTSYDISSQGSLSIGGKALGGFKSCSVTIEAETVDNYSRGDGGWTSAAPGRRSVTLEVTYLKLEDDDAQNGLKELMLDSTFQGLGVEIIYRSESKQTAPGTGFKGTFVLKSISESQTDGGDAVECTASFSGYGPLHTDTYTASAGGST